MLNELPHAAGLCRTKPNFLFIGPDKTGSSWLYEVLRQHPECYVPDCKDIYFFDRYYSRGLQWYMSFFDVPSPAVKAVGELSHDYLFSRSAARRIYDDLPDVRLLTCLRDPVERTFSHYLYMIRSGRTRLTFEEALGSFPELLNNSMYYKHLSEYFLIFERSRIKVLFFDDLQNDPGAFAKDVFDFLGISFVEGLDYDKKVLQASRPRSYLIARLVKAGANWARGIGLTRLVGVMKRGPLVNILYEPYAKDEKPKLSHSVRSKLVDVFAEDISRLEGLLDTDLGRWKRKTGK